MGSSQGEQDGATSLLRGTIPDAALMLVDLCLPRGTNVRRNLTPAPRGPPRLQAIATRAGILRAAILHGVHARAYFILWAEKDYALCTLGYYFFFFKPCKGIHNENKHPQSHSSLPKDRWLPVSRESFLRDECEIQVFMGIYSYNFPPNGSSLYTQLNFFHFTTVLESVP